MYTAVRDEGDPSIIGQVTHQAGSRSAQATFLAPVNNLAENAVHEMMDHLAVEAGNWGCLQLLAETDEHTLAYDLFRKAGFTIYGWQRIFHINPDRLTLDSLKDTKSSFSWQAAAEKDSLNLRLFYQSLVPAMVQPFENMLEKKVQGYYYKRDADVLGFADAVAGRGGIYVQPLVHPSVENIQGLLLALIEKLSNPQNLPIYLCVRSYQGWLENAAFDLNVSVSPRQALMVKRLSVTQRVTNEMLLPAFEKGLPEPSASVPATSRSYLTKS